MIYVDQFPGNGWGYWQGGGHLLTSDVEELHEFAKKIGLKREWFQEKTAPHYDLTANKRRQAIDNGATPVEFGQFPDDMLWCVPDPEGGYERTADRNARVEDYLANSEWRDWLDKNS